MNEDLRSIRVDEFLPYPPSRVWRALTTPDLLAQWLMDNDFKLEIGHSFTFRTIPRPAAKFDGVVHCEVLDFEIEKMLRISWVDPGTENGLNSIVTWRLEPEGHGTRLIMEHEGFDPDNPYQQFGRKTMSKGTRITMRRLAEVLATEAEGSPQGVTRSPLDR